MAEILPNASYVRNRKALEQRPQNAVLASIAEHADLDADEAAQVWELLETPQTVETIRRALGQDDDDATLGSDEVITLLSELYDEDLIQLSPDT